MIDDLISRRAAIETLLKGKIDEDESLVECPAECNSMIDGAIEDIKALPTADVRENVHAKWLREPNCFYRCSECGKHYPSICDNMDFRFCPNCGAEME